MIENQTLLSAVLANPDDDRPRLVYADWLEQQGQFERARLIRVQIELARLPDHTGPASTLEIEAEQLEAACEKALPQLDGIRWGGFQRGLVRTVVAATPAAFRQHASEIAKLGSIDRAWFDNRDGFDVLADVAVLARFTDLTILDEDNWGLRNGDPAHRFNDELQAVLESAHCPRLRSLDLTTCQLGPRGAKALACCSRLESLIHLNLLDNYIGDEGMAALAASPYLSALRNLRIDLNDLGSAGVEALATSVSLGGLEDLLLGDRIGPAAAVSLSRSPHLTHLRSLSLHDDIGDLGAAALAESPNLAGLTHLDVRCWLGPEGIGALAASPFLRRLKSLYLNGCDLGDDGTDALARSPILAEVEDLRLALDQLSDEGARALAASPYLARLKPGGLYLSLNKEPSDAGWQALRARFGDRIWKRRDVTEHQGSGQS